MYCRVYVEAGQVCFFCVKNYRVYMVAGVCIWRLQSVHGGWRVYMVAGGCIWRLEGVYGGWRVYMEAGGCNGGWRVYVEAA